MLPYLAASFAGVQVGATLYASEIIVGEVGAGQLGFWRYVIAIGVLFPFWVHRRGIPVSRRHFLPISLIGMGQFGVLVALLNVAVLFSTSSRVSLVFASLPFATLAFAWFLHGSRISARDLVAIGITFFGISVLLGADALAQGFTRLEALGLLAAFAATLTGALCSVLYRPYLRLYGAVQVSLIAMLASLLPLGLIAIFEAQYVSAIQWSSSTLPIIAGIGLSSGVGFSCWLYALANAPAGHVTAFLGLGPITAVVLSIVLDAATPSSSLLVTLVLVFLGLGLLALPTGEQVRQVEK